MDTQPTGYYATHKVGHEQYALTWIERYGPGQWDTWDTGIRHDWDTRQDVLTTANNGGAIHPPAPSECTLIEDVNAFEVA